MANLITVCKIMCRKYMHSLSQFHTYDNMTFTYVEKPTIKLLV